MGGRAVECTGLEIRQGRKSFVGSNPTPSANFKTAANKSLFGTCRCLARSATCPVAWRSHLGNVAARGKDGRYVTMIGLHPHLRDATLEHATANGSVGISEEAQY